MLFRSIKLLLFLIFVFIIRLYYALKEFTIIRQDFYKNAQTGIRTPFFPPVKGMPRKINIHLSSGACFSFSVSIYSIVSTRFPSKSKNSAFTNFLKTPSFSPKSGRMATKAFFVREIFSTVHNSPFSSTVKMQREI